MGEYMAAWVSVADYGRMVLYIKETENTISMSQKRDWHSLVIMSLPMLMRSRSNKSNHPLLSKSMKIAFVIWKNT